MLILLYCTYLTYCIHYTYIYKYCINYNICFLYFDVNKLIKNLQDEEKNVEEG